MNRVQQRLPRFMSLISIAQRETFHISFVQFANKGYAADLSTPESYYIKKACYTGNIPDITSCCNTLYELDPEIETVFSNP